MLENRNLSHSSLKVLEILFKLLSSKCKKDELLAGFSEDSLSIYLETLNRIGIKIKKEKKTKKYFIAENINLINFNSLDLNNIANIKKVMSEKTSVDNIIKLNNLFCDLAKITEPEFSNGLLEIAKDLPFGPKLHSKVLFLQECIKNKSSIKLIYNSPRKGNEEFILLPKYLKVSNLKLHLWAKDNSISDTRCLRLERIVSVEKIAQPIEETISDKFAICEVVSTFNFNKLGKERVEILEKNNESIKIKLFYYTTFELMQKVLKLGNECKILEPLDAQNELIEKLKLIRSLYG